jgi:hypothetical protein
MSISQINRDILRILQELEDIDDQVLFGSNEHTYDELIQMQEDLDNDLEGLLLLSVDYIMERYAKAS